MADHFTSITFGDIAKLQQPRQSYLDLLLFDEKEVQEKIAKSTPLVKVIITRLEARQKYFDSANAAKPALTSLDFAELLLEEKFLYDLGELGRAMCLTVGRYSHNHFRPFINDECKDMDPYISREHGLVFLNEKRQVCYHDIGTFKKGSTNGTKLNDIALVKNEIMSWTWGDYFGLGECVSNVRSNMRSAESRFKIRIQKLEN